jgi:ABC-type antimicrobial peptide transport system permease subunit
MGIRLALGAPRLNLLRLVIVEGLMPVGAGIAVGLVIALASGRVVAAMLYRTSPSDRRCSLWRSRC